MLDIVVFFVTADFLDTASGCCGVDCGLYSIAFDFVIATAVSLVSPSVVAVTVVIFVYLAPPHYSCIYT